MKSKKVVKVISSAFLIVVLATLLFVGACAPRGPINIVYSSENPPTQHGDVLFIEMAERWAESTDGRLVVEPHFSAELYEVLPGLDALSLNALQMTQAPTYFLEAWDPEFKVLGIPFIIKDFDHFTRMEGTAGYKAIQARFEEKGVKFFTPNTFEPFAFQLFTKDPVRSLEDLKGKKVRVPGGESWPKMGKLLGFNAISINPAEVSVALQTGMVEGVIGDIDPAFMKFMGTLDYMNYCTIVYFTVAGSYFLTSTEFWNNLPDDIRQKMEAEIPWLMQKAKADLVKSQQAGFAALDEAGIEVINLTDAEMGRWVKACAPMYEEVAAEIGWDLINQIKAVR